LSVSLSTYLMHVIAPKIPTIIVCVFSWLAMQRDLTGRMLAFSVHPGEWLRYLKLSPVNSFTYP